MNQLQINAQKSIQSNKRRHLIKLSCASTLLLMSGCIFSSNAPHLPENAIIVAFGDSITSGYGLSPEQAWPAQLSKISGWVVLNEGVWGDTANSARDRIESVLSRHAPDLIVIELGGNDFLRSVSPITVKGYLKEIVLAAKAKSIPVALIAVPEAAIKSAVIDRLKDSPIYEDLSSETNSFLIEDVISKVLSDETLRIDRLHPNARGHEVIARHIAKSLKAPSLN